MAQSFIDFTIQQVAGEFFFPFHYPLFINYLSPGETKSASKLRDLLRLLSKQAVNSPIETAGAVVVAAVAIRHALYIAGQSSFYALFSDSSPHVEDSASPWVGLASGAKWVILILALSLTLNGYLLRGIAAALTEKGVSRDESVPQVVDKPESTTTTPAAEEPEQEPEISPAPTPISKLTLESLDESFRARGWLPPTPLSNSSASSVKDLSDEPIPVRSLSECIDIFENGPRPQSLSVSLLNDEEVIMLVQNGKIATYSLEKVLDGGNHDNMALERAVRIRRALICTCTLLLHWNTWTESGFGSSRIEDQDA